MLFLFTRVRICAIEILFWQAAYAPPNELSQACQNLCVSCAHLPTVGFRFLNGRLFLYVVAFSCVADFGANVAFFQNDRGNRRECPSLRFALLISPKQYEKTSDDHSADYDG